MDKKKLVKHITGSTNLKENQEILTWLKADVKNQNSYSLLKATVLNTEFDNVNTSNTDLLYSKIKSKIALKNRFYKISIAATIALLLSLGGFYLKNTTNKGFNSDLNKLAANEKMEEVTTKIGAKLLVTLPDGSTVLLNSKSKLLYPENFNSNFREVTLIGEALFDITHNPDQPFIVKTDNYNIKVLGTTFNVKSYTKDKETATTLITGKVEILRDKKEVIILKPSQKATFSKKEKHIKIKEVVSSDIIAWKDGSLIFDKTSMEQVILDLERRYSIKININSPKLLKYEYTGTFNDLTIDEVLSIIAISSPITFTKSNNIIVLKMK